MEALTMMSDANHRLELPMQEIKVMLHPGLLPGRKVRWNSRESGEQKTWSRALHTLLLSLTLTLKFYRLEARIFGFVLIFRPCGATD